MWEEFWEGIAKCKLKTQEKKKKKKSKLWESKNRDM